MRGIFFAAIATFGFAACASHPHDRAHHPVGIEDTRRAGGSVGRRDSAISEPGDSSSGSIRGPADGSASPSNEGAHRCAREALVREEVRIPSQDPSIALFVMRVATPHERRRGAVVFTHGAGSASSAIWDLRTGDHSFMRALACAGFDTYALDIRGFGGSTMPRALSSPPEGAPPAVRAAEVIDDVDAIMRFATATSSVSRADLIGWSWGAEVAGLYAGLHPGRVRRLVLLSPVYDRKWPSRHRQEGAWYPLTRRELDALYPPEREDRAVYQEFVTELFRFTTGDALRIPSGPYRDIYGEDAPLWDPAKVRAPTLILRGDADRASLDEHASRLFAHLTFAPERRYVVLAGLGHFVFREHRHRQVYGVVSEFLCAPLVNPDS